MLTAAGVSADEAVHVGDSPRFDIAGASPAGLATVLIDRSGRWDLDRLPPEERPDAVIRTLAEPPLCSHAGGRMSVATCARRTRRRLACVDLGAVLVVVAAYLLGSVDFAVLVARAKVSISIPSGAATWDGQRPADRGEGAAAMVMAGDLLKGVIAAAAGLLITGDIVIGYAAGAAAVLGHCFHLAPLQGRQGE